MNALLGPNGKPIDRSEYFRKAPPPRVGEAYGGWSGPFANTQQLTLPGGGLVQFDLDRLTLGDYRQMRSHYQVNASLSLLTFMIHQLDWRIDCEDASIASFLERELENIWTRLIRGVSQAYWAGYSPMVQQYENDTENRKIRLDKIKDLIPEDCTVNWKEVLGPPRPHNRPRTKHYVYDGIRQVGNFDPIPADHTLWYPLLMENGNYYGRKLLKPAFPAFFFSILLHLFANRYFERFGEPLPIGRAPFDDEVEVQGQTMRGREAMEQVLHNIRNRAVVVLPADRAQGTNEYEYQLEYLESQMRGADFERYMNRLDEEMSLGIFTPVLLFRTADVGSYNLGQNHMQVWMWMLNALAGDLKDYLEHYVLERLKAVNFSPRAPKVKWNYRKMGKENTEVIRTIVAELMRSGQLGVSDLEQLGQYIGLDLKEVQQLVDEPEDPSGDGNPQEDNRVGRPERRPTRPQQRVRSIQAAQGVVTEIADRLHGQVEKAIRNDDMENFAPKLGFRRKFEECLREGGFTAHEAHVQTETIYNLTTAWIRDALAMDDAASIWGGGAFRDALIQVMNSDLEACDL